MIDVKLVKRGARGTYVMRWWSRGRQHQETAGTDFKLAKDKRLLKFRELNGLAPTAPVPGRGKPWAAFVEEYLDYHGQEVRPSTLSLTRRALRYFGEMCEPLVVEDIDVAMARRFRTLRKERKAQRHRAGAKGKPKELSPSSINRDVRILRTACEYAIDCGYLKANPFSRVKRLKVADPEPRVLSDEERAALLAACSDPMLHAAVYTALQTGVRLGELLALKWADVHLGDQRDRAGRIIRRAGSIYVRSDEDHRTKNDRSRWVLTDAEGVRLLVELNRQSASVHVFRPDRVGKHYRGAFERRFKRTVARAEIDHVTPHDLRDTCLTLLAEGGMPLPALKEYAGHRSIQTTMRYYVRVRARAVLDAAAEAKARVFGDHRVTKAPQRAEAAESPISVSAWDQEG